MRCAYFLYVHLDLSEFGSSAAKVSVLCDCLDWLDLNYHTVEHYVTMRFLVQK